jgi:hypothetical protein
MKKMIVVVMALLVAILFAPNANAAEARKGIVLATDGNIQGFATRNNITVDQLLEWNPELRRERPGGQNGNLRPMELKLGESLYIQKPPSQVRIEEPPASVTGPVTDEKELSPYMALGAGVGNSHQSDFFYGFLYFGKPILEWLHIIVAISDFRSTDKDYLTTGNTLRYAGGISFRTSHFIAEMKLGQDYNNGSGLSRGMNMEATLQGGYWRVWNEAIVFTNTHDWPYWYRDRLKVAALRGTTWSLSPGLEHSAYGWKNEDPNLRYKGYFYVLRGGGFLNLELTGKHPISVLVGAGSSDVEEFFQGKDGETRKYYLTGEVSIGLF